MMKRTTTITAEDLLDVTIHFVRAGLTYQELNGAMLQAHVAERGQELTITQGLIDATLDRHGIGFGWLNWIDDPDAQVRAFGKVLYARGSAPTRLPWLDGVERDMERSRQRDIAFKRPDPAERDAELRRIEATFGRPELTTTDWTRL